MDELEAIDELARQARKEEPLLSGVRGRVMAEIRAPSRSRVLPLALFAAVSAVAASAVLAVGAHYWAAAPEPLTELCVYLEVTTLW